MDNGRLRSDDDTMTWTGDVLGLVIIAYNCDGSYFIRSIRLRAAFVFNFCVLCEMMIGLSGSLCR